MSVVDYVLDRVVERLYEERKVGEDQRTSRFLVVSSSV